MRAIVLAGGGGTRLWPLSREKFPKQFLKIGSGLSLLQTTVDRLLKAPFIEEIIISTNAHHLSLVQEQLQELSPSKNIQILVEPARKNTAPAIALAVKYLQTFCQAKPSDPILVLPSDHSIEPASIFLDALEQMETVSKTQTIITFGIRPTRAETGYGYIQIGKKRTASTFTVQRFVEKPNLTTAKAYLSDPHFYWNSGMFLFSINTFWKELRTHAPAIHSLASSSYEELMERFNQMPDLSIDYAVMEKTKNLLIYPLSIQWSDIGSWDSVYDILEKDGNGNVKMGQISEIDTKDSLLISTKRLVSAIGVEDMLIIETDDAVFVSKRGLSQKVKGLVESLSQKGRKETTSHPEQSYPWGSSRTLDKEKDYRVEKILLNPRQSYEHGETQVIPLHGEITIEDGRIVNHASHPIEFLLIKHSASLSAQT